MKKQLLFLMLFAPGVLIAQETQQISTGAGYSFQSFANLEAGTERQVSNSAWDIAFTVTPDDAGIFINESVGSAGGLLPIELFYTLSGDFAADPDPDIFAQFPLMNIEKTWSYGAFNETRSPEDPEDYGWGYYNPGTGEIIGSNVYGINHCILSSHRSHVQCSYIK